MMYEHKSSDQTNQLTKLNIKTSPETTAFSGAMMQLVSMMERHIQSNPAQWMMLEAAWCEDQDATSKGYQQPKASVQ